MLIIYDNETNPHRNASNYMKSCTTYYHNNIDFCNISNSIILENCNLTHCTIDNSIIMPDVCLSKYFFSGGIIFSSLYMGNEFFDLLVMDRQTKYLYTIREYTNGKGGPIDLRNNENTTRLINRFYDGYKRSENKKYIKRILLETNIL